MKLEGLICNWCGKALTGCTFRREYCNSKCRQSHYTALAQAARAEARKTQKCLFCGGPMRADYPGRIYCSAKCKIRAGTDLAKTRRACRHCGKSYRGGGPYCSHRCYADAKRTLHPKACEVCGTTFDPHRADQRACSQPCRGVLVRALPDIACKWCGMVFRPKQATTRFCGRSCVMRARNAKG